MLRLTIFLIMLLLANTASTPNTLIVSTDCLDLSYIYTINKNLAEIEGINLFKKKTIKKDESYSEERKEEIEKSPKFLKKRAEKGLIKKSKTIRVVRELGVSRISIAFNQDSGIDMDIHEDLKMALIECPNKDATITSGRRHSGYRRSLHRSGKAIDIHQDSDYIDWLISKDGISWLNQYNLEFFIEDCSKKGIKKLKEEHRKYFRWVPWCTGLHTHLNLKR